MPQEIHEALQEIDITFCGDGAVKPGGIDRLTVQTWAAELTERMIDTGGRFSITQLNCDLGVGPTIGRAARELGYLELQGSKRWGRWRWVYGRLQNALEVIDEILAKAQEYNSRAFMKERREASRRRRCNRGRVCEG